MIIFLLIFEKIFLNKGLIIDLKSHKKVSKHPNAWYYIYCENISLISQYINFSTEFFLPMTSNLFSISLNHNEALKLFNNEKIWIKKISSKEKIKNSLNNFYSAIISNNCSIPGKIISKSNNYIVFYYDGPILKLSKIKCIRLINPYSNGVRFHTRFHRSITHNISNSLKYSSTSNFNSFSNLHILGYNGTGQCISIVDNGVDIESPWLKSIPNKLPKIRAYFDIGDLIDNEGHGTFIAGVAAGYSECNEFSQLYNGVAFGAQILPVDIFNSTSKKHVFPLDISDMYEAPLELGCPISLNAWTNSDSLLSTALDFISYKNPELLMIFPATSLENNLIDSPADSKNVLTIGSSHGHPASRAAIDSTLPIVIHSYETNTIIIGYGDESGSPFLNSSIINLFDTSNLTIGDKYGQVALIMDERINLSLFINISAALIFHYSKIEGKYSFPIIRMPLERKSFFSIGSKVSISISPRGDDDMDSLHKIDKNSGFNTIHPFQIKPEIIIPGGPLIGPKSGGRSCDMNSLTVKGGSSISSAIAAGDIAIIRQYLVSKLNTNQIKSSLIKALYILSSSDLSDLYPDSPSKERGWGTPQLESILIPSKENNLYLNQNLTIEKESRTDFCFTATGNGIIKASISWIDYPRDPSSLSLITSPLFLTVTTEKNSQNHILSNNRKEDYPSLDIFNTIKRIDLPVSNGQKIRLSITSGKFEYLNLINYSLVIFGPFDISKNPNFDCNNYFESSPCPRQCEGGRGATCQKSKSCFCPQDRGGDFCGFKVEKAPIGQIQYIDGLRKFEWKILKVFPEKWSTNSKLILNLEKIDLNKVGFLINIGKVPKWNEYLCSNLDCPWSTLTKDKLILNFEEWDFVNKANPFYFGFYSKNEDPINFEVLFLYESLSE